MADWAPRALTIGLWLTWLAYWMVAARNAKTDSRTEPLRSRAAHLVPLWAGVALLLYRHGKPAFLFARFVPDGPIAYWTGALLVAAGLAFSSWARQHLGGNWSGSVTLKQDHELIRTGPYAIVRHPIYSGLLTALLGTAIIIGQWRAIIGLVLIAAAFLRRVCIEERLMREIFADQHARYRAEVPALIPLIY